MWISSERSIAASVARYLSRIYACACLVGGFRGSSGSSGWSRFISRRMYLHHPPFLSSRTAIVREGKIAHSSGISVHTNSG